MILEKIISKIQGESLQAIFVQAFAWNHLAKIIEFILIYGFSVIVARHLGPFQNGIYATIVSISQIILVVSSAGIDIAINRYLPTLSNIEHHGRIVYIVRYSLLIKLIIILILCVIIVISWQNIQKIYNLDSPTIQYLAFILIYGVVRACSSFLTAVWLSQLQTKLLFIINTFVAIVQIIAIALLATNGLTIESVIYVVIGGATGGLIVQFVLSRKFIFSPSERVIMKPIILFGGWLWISNVLDYFYGKQGDIMLLNFFSISKTSIGYYDIAYALSQLPGFALFAGLIGITLSTFAKLASESISTVVSFWKKLSGFITQLIVPIYCFAGIFAFDIISIIYTKEYSSSVSLFYILIGARIIARIFGGGETTSALLSLQKERAVVLISIAGGVLNIILNLIFIPRLGVAGAAYATGVTTILVDFSVWLLFWKIVNAPLLFLQWTFAIVNGILPAILTKTIFPEPNLEQLIISAVLCIIFWIINIYLIYQTKIFKV